jgi:hypothetical protein
MMMMTQQQKWEQITDCLEGGAHGYAIGMDEGFRGEYVARLDAGETAWDIAQEITAEFDSLL